MGVLDDGGIGIGGGRGGGGWLRGDVDCHGVVDGSGMDDDVFGVMVDRGVTDDSVSVIAVVVTEGLHVVE